MAVLDPRLLPLIETLVAVDADWLAIEVINGISRGKEQEESEESLAQVRDRVRSGEPGKRRSIELPLPAAPILGDDQVIWAEKYIGERVDSGLANLAQSLTLLETVAATPPPRLRDQAVIAKAVPSEPIKIVILDQEDQAVDRQSIEAARRGLRKLRQALENWSLNARGLTKI